MLTKEDLSDLGITVLGDIKKTFYGKQKQVQLVHWAKQAVQTLSSKHQLQNCLSSIWPYHNSKSSKWTEIKNLPENQIHEQLYNACSESVQNSLVNTESDFLLCDKRKKWLKHLKWLLQKCNPMVHQLHFRSDRLSTNYRKSQSKILLLD